MKRIILSVVFLFALTGIAQGQVTFPKGSLSGPTTVARLPTSHNSNILYDVRDANSDTDCTVGGGTTRIVCKWNGSAYAAVGGSGGGGGAPTDATYITQTPNAGLSAEQAMSALATGIIKNTTATGVFSIAVAGDFPTLNQNTTGTAANLSGTPALPNGTTATTQSQADNSTKLATTAYVDTGLAGVGDVTQATDLTGLLSSNRADANVYSDGGVTPAVAGSLVQQINDQSSNANNLTQSTSGKRGIYQINKVSGKPYITLDGVDDFFTFPAQLTTIRTVVFVGRVTSTGTSDSAPLLGDPTAFDWIGGATEQVGLLVGDFADTTVLNGTAYVNGFKVQGVAANTPGLPVSKPGEFAVVVITTTGNTRATYFTNDRNAAGRVLPVDFLELDIFNRALSFAEVQALTAALKKNWGLGMTAPQMLIDGNSMTSQGNYLADVLTQLNTDGQRWDQVSFAFTGKGTSQLITDGLAKVDPLRDPSRLQVYLGWEITNALYGGDSAATAYNDYVTLCRARQAAGFKVIAMTVMPRSNAATPATFEASRQTVNANIRANWATFADELSDPASDPLMGQSGQSTNTTYYSDGVHLTDTGRAIVAAYPVAAFERLSGKFRTVNAVTVNVPTVNTGTVNLQNAQNQNLQAALTTNSSGDLVITATEKAPAAPAVALAAAGAGNVDNGTHYYYATFVTAAGETNASPVSSVVTVTDKTTDGKVAVSGIPLGSSNVTARKLYRTTAGTLSIALLTTISDNTTTTFTDNVADASLTPGFPGVNSTANPLVTLTNAGVLSATKVSTPHLIGSGSTPSIANGAGAGTTPGTPSIIGTDTAGQITIITGTLPSVSAVAVTVTFASAYGSAPYVVIWPANANAATLGFLPFVGSTATTFTVNTGTIALGGSTTYIYNYVIVGGP